MKNIVTKKFTQLAGILVFMPLTASVMAAEAVTIEQHTVTVRVQGLPQTTSDVSVSFTPENGTASVTKKIPLAQGMGQASVQLPANADYVVSTGQIPRYQASFSQQPMTPATDNTETITFDLAPGGRMIGYLPGWVDVNSLPTARDLAAAGYTDILVAFGVFSTTRPGAIVSAFSSLSADYIAQLRSAGLNVSLSIGGASTSIADTSVNFHAVLNAAASPAEFKQNFIQSVQQLRQQYGFNGIDIDIEHGINGEGQFTQPSGDIAVLADIIRQLHQDDPKLIISLAPQSANIGATSGFDGVWGNYAALVMQTHDALSWVGIQLYNTGCVYGIDSICYPNPGGDDPDFAVAMAVDLLADWPQTQAGRATGFQPYVSYLRPDQVVLGYPAPDNQGHSDGAPVTSQTGIKRAIACLQTGVQGCALYQPPQAYANIGGVFNWEVTYDQRNDFQFAKGLTACVKYGACD